MIHTDHLGTPQKMTDGTGAVVWSADYKPFGEATVTASTITNNLRFPGQYFDAETGLNYNYYRDYNPVIGRYLESDPLLLPFIHNRATYFVPSAFVMTPGHLHDYLYVRNSPMNRVDSKGLDDATSGSGPSSYPGNAGAAGSLNSIATGLTDFNLGDRTGQIWSFKRVCAKPCPQEPGVCHAPPKDCCLEWKWIFYMY